MTATTLVASNPTLEEEEDKAGHSCRACGWSLSLSLPSLSLSSLSPLSPSPFSQMKAGSHETQNNALWRAWLLFLSRLPHLRNSSCCSSLILSISLCLRRLSNAFPLRERERERERERGEPHYTRNANLPRIQYWKTGDDDYVRGEADVDGSEDFGKEEEIRVYITNTHTQACFLKIERGDVSRTPRLFLPPASKQSHY